MLRPLLVIICIAIAGFPSLAQMTTEQREHEFKNLVGLYARTYAPYNWKIQSLGVNALDIQSWVRRVRNAKTDVEFFEICSEYVATFQDGHARYVINSSFRADLGMWVDLYDGKVLVEAVDRIRYPSSTFPIRIGDEVVSMDGVAVDELIRDLSKYRGFGNPRGTMRIATDGLTHRSQQSYPGAIQLPDTTQVVIRNSVGELNAYTLTWEKTGLPLENVSPTPWPQFNISALKNLQGESSLDEQAFAGKKIDENRTPYELQWSSISTLEKDSLERTIHNEAGEEVKRKSAIGWGQVIPYFNPPAGFQARRITESFLSGTYMSNGYRIGFIRIAHFSPSDPEFESYVFDREIQFMRQATDGLVIDDSRNTGGYGCLSLDYAQRLIPYPFNFIRAHFRPSQQNINSMYATVERAKARGAEDWIIHTYQFLFNDLLDASKNYGAVTGPMPFCVPFYGRDWAPTMENYPITDEEGKVAAYEKPLIVLVDELSASTGDIFPAVIQDAKRGLLVGMRTAGLGGSVLNTRTGIFSEATGYQTQSLLVRDTEAEAPGIPPSKFIENVGVVPDVELDYMKKENLLTNGQPFVEKFTSIIVEEIRKSKEGQ